MSEPPSQSWNPEQYAENARFVSDLGAPVIDLLSPRSGEYVLDLGCGDGELTRRFRDLGCKVVGIDSSPAMVAAARSVGIDARVSNGEDLKLTDEFDAVFSNAALHWMREPERVIAGVWRALKPGGRFVGEFGGEGNVAAIVNALESTLFDRGLEPPNPWFFPSPRRYRSLLESAGFSVDEITLTPRPTRLPTDIKGWLDTFAQPYTSVLPASDRESFLAEVVEALRPVLTDEDGTCFADYVRLRFSARKSSTSDDSLP